MPATKDATVGGARPDGPPGEDLVPEPADEDEEAEAAGRLVQGNEHLAGIRLVINFHVLVAVSGFGSCALRRWRHRRR